MFRFAMIAALLLPLSAAAQSLSDDIAAHGIQAAADRLQAIADPTPADRFALGGVLFLRGVERALQTRYRYALSPELTMIPVLRLPVPPNPAPEPFTPEAVPDLFRALLDDMALVETQMAAIPDDADMGVVMRPADIWFDIDGDGTRGKGEDLYAVLGPMMFSRTGVDAARLPTIEVRFDVADARWLAAYGELIRAVSLTVLAYDPTDAIRKVIETKAKLAEINSGMTMMNALDMNLGSFVDSTAVILLAAAQQPDKAKTAQALTALLHLVDQNRAFWTLVRAETDDDREWIPNDRQHSGLGMTVPQGTGEIWLQVLADAEGALQGKLLVPYWRLAGGAGLNLNRIFLDPPAIDPVGWVQGHAALPYADRGPRMTADSWRRFNDLVEGRGLMFALLLN